MEKTVVSTFKQRFKHQYVMAMVLVVTAWLGTFRIIARDVISANSGPKEPVCGFLKNFYYFEQDAVTQGLSVDLKVTKAQLEQPVTLQFFVHQKPGDVPVDKLQLQHEKYMHVIGVRDDLNEFFHIHPVEVSPGLWKVNHAFTNAGNYKIWSEVNYRDVSYSFGHPLVTLPGAFGNADNDRQPVDRAVSSGYQITVKHSEPLFAGRASNLEFLIRDAAGKEVETENFLGAPMHLIIVKDDLSICLHAHPEAQRRDNPMVSFIQVFPREGLYRLFAQFRPKGTKLAEDEAVFAPFYVRVIASPAAQVLSPKK